MKCYRSLKILLKELKGYKMAKCIECEFYLTAKDTGNKPGCLQDGDVSSPKKDINCVEGGDKELCSTTPPPETIK